MGDAEADEVEIALRMVDAAREEAAAERAARRLATLEAAFLYRCGGSFPVPAPLHRCDLFCEYVQLAPDAAGCRTSGRIHVCGGDACDRAYRRASGLICYATGRVLGSTINSSLYKRVEPGHVGRAREPDADAPGTPAAKRPRLPPPLGCRPAPHVHAPAGLEYEAERIVWALLYGPGRAAANERRASTLETTYEREARRYLKVRARSGLLPSSIDLLRIRLNAEHRKRALAILPADDARVARYARTAVRLWSRLRETPYGRSSTARVTFSDHVLGVLNLHSYGLVIREVTILDADPFLWQHLPPVSDLRFFGFAKRSLTAGKNHVSFALRSAVNHMPLESLRGSGDDV